MTLNKYRKTYMIYYGLYGNLTWLIQALRTDYGTYQVNDLLNPRYSDFPVTWIDTRLFAISFGYLRSVFEALLAVYFGPCPANFGRGQLWPRSAESRNLRETG